jgi:hypothetical protein
VLFLATHVAAQLGGQPVELRTIGIPRRGGSPQSTVNGQRHMVNGQCHMVNGQRHMVDVQRHMVDVQRHMVNGQRHVTTVNGM